MKIFPNKQKFKGGKQDRMIGHRSQGRLRSRRTVSTPKRLTEEQEKAKGEEPLSTNTLMRKAQIWITSVGYLNVQPHCPGKVIKDKNNSGCWDHDSWINHLRIIYLC